MNYKRSILIVSLFIAPAFCFADEDIKEVDLSLLNERGMLMYVLTDGRPIWIAYRTKQSILKIEQNVLVEYPDDPANIDKKYRSYDKHYFVVFGGCPKGDELPAYYPDDGFICLSNCASFDISGRPINDCAGIQPMEIPEHHFKDKKTIIIPVHQDGTLSK